MGIGLNVVAEKRTRSSGTLSPSCSIRAGSTGPASEWRHSAKDQGPYGIDVLIVGPSSGSPVSAKDIFI